MSVEAQEERTARNPEREECLLTFVPSEAHHDSRHPHQVMLSFPKEVDVCEYNPFPSHTSTEIASVWKYSTFWVILPKIFPFFQANHTSCGSVHFILGFCNDCYIIPISPGDLLCIFSCQRPNVCGLCNHGPEHQGILINQRLVIYEFRKDPYSAGNIWVIPDRPTCWALDYGWYYLKHPSWQDQPLVGLQRAMLYQLG